MKTFYFYFYFLVDRHSTKVFLQCMILRLLMGPVDTDAFVSNKKLWNKLLILDIYFRYVNRWLLEFLKTNWMTSHRNLNIARPYTDIWLKLQTRHYQVPMRYATDFLVLTLFSSRRLHNVTIQNLGYNKFIIYNILILKINFKK
jgi:hypothetical protein